MRMKRQQVEPGTLRRVMKYLGKREPSPPSIDHTQPMETIGGSESEDTTYLSALLPRIEQLPPGIVVEETEMGRPPRNGSSKSDANATGAGSTSRWLRPPAVPAAK